MTLYILIFQFLESRQEDQRIWTELWQGSSVFLYVQITC